MRIKRIALAMAVALVALAAFASTAFAKEKMVFGEFEATIAGKTISPSSPGKLGVYKEGDIEVVGVSGSGKDKGGLNLGGTEFGPRYSKDVVKETEPGKGTVLHKAGEIEVGKPACLKSKVVGSVTSEHFSELAFKLVLKKCITYLEEQGNPNRNEERFSNITLPIVLRSNWSAEIGARESVLEIPETALSVKLGLKKCPILIPEQTIPQKDNPEKLYEEVVEYEDEAEEPEGIEHSKKLKEMYPDGTKHLLNVIFGEKFKSIITYGSNSGPCGSTKEDENAKIVENPESKYNGMIEFHNGHLFGEIFEMEVKFGDLGFNEPV